MNDHETIRAQVARAYGRAVSAPASGACCATTEPKGVAARSAGYDPEDFAAMPADAVANAFGCGNPVAFAGMQEGDVVVDLGSGAGIDLILAARKVGPTGRVIGIDMTDEMIRRAETNVRAAGLANVEVRRGLIEDLPVETASADWVISNCVINLSPEKSRVFAEIARVLKPGGRISVTDIVVQHLPERVRRDPGLYCGCVAGAISEAEYVRGLRDAGLADVRVPDRLAYDEQQLAAFVASEPAGAEAGGDCGCGGATGDATDGLAREMAGNVWSARVVATKPG